MGAETIVQHPLETMAIGGVVVLGMALAPEAALGTTVYGGLTEGLGLSVGIASIGTYGVMIIAGASNRDRQRAAVALSVGSSPLSLTGATRASAPNCP